MTKKKAYKYYPGDLVKINMTGHNRTLGDGFLAYEHAYKRMWIDTGTPVMVIKIITSGSALPTEGYYYIVLFGDKMYEVGERYLEPLISVANES